MLLASFLVRTCFSFTFAPFFFSCFTVLIIASHRFLLLIDFSSSSYLLHSFMLPLVLASLALAMVTSCPFWPCVFMFTHLGINACPLHLLLLYVSSAHSSTTQSSCRFFPSLVAPCIFETYLQFTPHWSLITHVDDLPSHFTVYNNLVSPSAALYHDNHSFSFSLRSAMVLLHFPSVAQPTLNSLTPGQIQAIHALYPTDYKGTCEIWML